MDNNRATNTGSRRPIGPEAGILTTLQHEHDALVLLIEGCLRAEPYERQDLYATMRSSLERHSQCEEASFYARCAAYPSLAELIDEAEGDHELGRQLLAEIDETPLQSPRWHLAMRELRSLFCVHAAFEESRLFSAAREVLTLGQLRDMDRVYKRLREERVDTDRQHTVQHVRSETDTSPMLGTRG